MSRSTTRSFAVLLLGVTVLLGVAIAMTAGPSKAARANSFPVPAASATPPLRVLAKGGTVNLLTDPGQSKNLFSGGAVPLALAPGSLKLTDDAFRFSFAIKAGNINPVSLAAYVAPAGGFEFWGRQTMSAWTVLSFTSLRIGLGAKSSVSAVFDSTLGRHTILLLDLSKKRVTHFVSKGHSWLRVAGIHATMSGWLVSQLTGAFPSYAPVNHYLGSLMITLRLS